MAGSRIGYSVIFYVLSVMLVIVARPATVFDRETGELKRFGTGGSERRESLASMGVVVVALAVACHFTFALIDVVF
jgi:hypothetical protein